MSLADSHRFSTWSRCDDEKPRPCSSGCALARARRPVTMGSRPQMSLHAPITSRTVVGPWSLGGREVHTLLAGRAESGGGCMLVTMSEDPPSRSEMLWVVGAHRGVPLGLRCPAKRRISPARGGARWGEVRRAPCLHPAVLHVALCLLTCGRGPRASAFNQREGGEQGSTAAPCVFC